MLPTRHLSSLKIFPKINQPIVNQQEAQRVLKALKASFRRHLDDEHGSLHDDSPACAAPPPPSHSSPKPAAARHRPRDGHQRPTDRHLRAILSNPLFSYDAAAAQRAADHPSGTRDPLDTFDEAVARGLMNPAIAAGCLMTKRNQIIRSGALSVQDEMAASGAAVRVVSWLRASGLERDLSFASHRRLTRYLVMFMVAEGLDEIVWGWIERLMQAGEPEAAADSSHMLGRLVAAKAPGDATLDASYTALLAGQERCQKLPEFRRTFLWPWFDLSWRSTVDAWYRSSPSAALHESFVELGERLRVKRGQGMQIAHLDLHHPTRPSPDAALQALQRDSLWRRAESTEDIQRFSTKIMSMGLDAVKHLTRAGEAQEAQRIMDLLNEKSRLHLGSNYDGLWLSAG